MDQKYFMAANSANGFFSLFGGFPPEKGDFTHIIKAGPGGGKSSYMRKIADEAGRRGMDVHFIMCSGDPRSLDGIYIPLLKTAWLDGTEPHSREPLSFGVDADYTDLSRFMSRPLSGEDKDFIRTVTSEYKEKYSEAYSLLLSCAGVKKAAEISPAAEDVQRTEKMISSIIGRSLTKSGASESRITKRFYSCISCEGTVCLSSEIEAVCSHIYELDDRFSEAHELLRYVLREAVRCSQNVIICPSPLMPERISAVIMPEAGLCFADSSWQMKNAAHISLDNLISAAVSAQEEAELSELEKIYGHLYSLAVSRLSEAKALHDKLEEIYAPLMDYDELNEFTSRQIADIFR